MALPEGTRLGPYEVIELLGAGGMGEVYRARDPRLDRQVAIKVLPEAASRDASRLRRFEQEARAAGALNHPNVLAVHDVGLHEATSYVVSELLEGETLRARIRAGGLSLRRAVAYAVEIARGLAAAHERGIVHRDLKPENLFLTNDGHLKILDFGLAKLRDDGQSVDAGSETRTDSWARQAGIVLGTVGYASPEQVRRASVDHRSDIFSFGAVLYEMLAKRRAFQRETAAETLTAILNEDPPPLSEVDPTVSPSLERIVRRCLEKRPQDRFQSPRDLAFALEAVPFESGAAAVPAGRPPARLRGAALLFAAVGVALAGGFLLWRVGRRASAEPPVVRYITFSGQDEGPAVSPDGRTIAFVSGRDGRRRIWLAHPQTGEEAPLTDGPHDDHPRFARDGSALLFVRVAANGEGALYRAPVLGGEPRRLIDDARAGGEWSPDGRGLAFVRRTRTGAQSYELWIGAADGSGAREVARVPAQWATPPRWSPDGRRIAFAHGQGAAALWSTLVVDPETGEQIRLEPPLRFGVLSVPAWCCGGNALLFMQSESGHGRLGGRLVRQEVPSGRTSTVLREQAMGSGLDVLGPESVVFDVYPTRGSLREQLLDGDEAGDRWLTRGFSDDRQPTYAADGGRIVFTSNRGGNLDLWELAPANGHLRRLTDDVAEDLDPHLMRDGRLLWSSKRSGSFEVWMAEADGSSPRQVTRDGFDAENPAATPDGRWVVYSSANPKRRGLWKVRSDGTDETHLVPGPTGLPEVSPDGRLVLYGDYDTPVIRLRVVQLADGQPVPFEIELGAAIQAPRTRYIRGRARWTADGRAIAFADQDEHGVNGVFVQGFQPGQDTTGTRRRLAGFEPERVTESFGLSADGRRIALSTREISSHVLLASGVPGLDR